MIVKPADRTGKVQEYYFSQKLAQIDRMSGKELILLISVSEVLTSLHQKTQSQL